MGSITKKVVWFAVALSVVGLVQADVLYNIASFNNDGSTIDNNGGDWKVGITTITLGSGITGSSDADLLADQTISATVDTSTAGSRFQNVGCANDQMFLRVFAE